MNILFAGTPANSAEVLNSLAKIKHINIKGVLTQPDKRGNRGNITIESPVAILAKKLKLNVFKPESINQNDLVSELKLLDIDFLIVIAYGKIIPSWLLELPSKLSINVHFSILPKYRGASPIQSALLNGDSSSGISMIKMSEHLDAGDIISSFNIKIDPKDNKLTLEKKLTDICIEELPKILTLVKSNKIELKEQNDSSASYCKKIVKSDSIIDFNDKAINIINKFRAYYEWPGLSFLYKDNIIKIHEIKEVGINSNNEPGTINKLSKDGLYVNTTDLVVVITYLQFPNKKIISSSDVYNSYRSFFQ